jgi:hypothetical protein
LHAPLEDLLEAGALGAADAIGERIEGPALEQVRRVDGVPRSAKRVREGEEAASLALCVMKQQNLSHACLIRPFGGRPVRAASP